MASADFLTRILAERCSRGLLGARLVFSGCRRLGLLVFGRGVFLSERAEASEDGRLDRAVLCGGGFEEGPFLGADPEHDLAFEGNVAGVSRVHACRDSSLARIHPLRLSGLGRGDEPGSASRAIGYPFCVASERGNAEARQARQPTPGEDPAADRLEPPSQAAREVIAAHLTSRHEIAPSELDRHIYLGGPREESQIISWNPALATFRCERCQGNVFATGELTRERVMLAQLWDDSLKPFLAGARTSEERDEITRLYLEGKLADAVVLAGRKLSRRRPSPAARPSVGHRRARVQAWMLERYAVRGVFERVIEEAAEMQRGRPDEWQQICDLKLAPSTLRRYWQLIDDERVEQAKQAHQRLKS